MWETHGRSYIISTSKNDNQLAIGTWNIWHSGSDWKLRQDRILSAVTDLPVDVWLMQETPLELENPQFYSSLREEGFDIATDVEAGLAIASRNSFENTQIIKLPSADTTAPRNCLQATFTIGTRTVSLYNTHLSWKFFESQLRRQQLATILQVIETDNLHTPNTVSVLGGDFNAEPDSDEVRALKGRSTPLYKDIVFHDAGEFITSGSSRNTWVNRNPYSAPEREPDGCIDYLFVGWQPNHRGRVIDCQVLNEPRYWASDHLAITATLDIS